MCNGALLCLNVSTQSVFSYPSLVPDILFMSSNLGSAFFEMCCDFKQTHFEEWWDHSIILCMGQPGLCGPPGGMTIMAG